MKPLLDLGKTMGPPKPDRTCEICNQKVEYIQNPKVDELGILKELSIFRYLPNPEGHEICQSILEERQRAFDREEEERQDRIKREERLRYSNLTQFQRRRFSEVTVHAGIAEAYATITTWQNESWGVALVGPTGVGKTLLATAFVMEQVLRGNRARFCNFRDLIGVLRQKSLQACADEEEIKAIRKAPILVLDDVGAERSTPYTVDVLTNILEYRLNHKLPLFLTTNANEKEMIERLNERVYSRIKASCALVPVCGSDQRNNVQFELQKRIAKQKVQNQERRN
jgi:DNA replication protein DnaC